MFTGKHPLLMDDKKRVQIPAKWRHLFDGPAFLTVSPSAAERCIVVYTKEGFERAVAEVREAGTKSQEARDEFRRVFSNADNASLDAQGRMVLPAELVAYAGLTRELMAVAAGDWFEYWDKATWETYIAARGARQ